MVSLKSFRFSFSVFFILLLLINGRSATAQQSKIIFKNFSNEPLLEQNLIYDIKQDDRGILWLATYNGLIKYDGYTFTLLTTAKEGKKLPAYPYNSLFIDHEILWAGTLGGGLLRINLKNNDFQLYKNILGNDNSLSNNYVYRVKKDKDNNILILLDNYSLDILNFKTGKIVRYDKVKSNWEQRNFKISDCLSDQNVFLDHSGFGSVNYEKSSNKVIELVLDTSDFRELKLTNINKIDLIRIFYHDKEDNVWFLTMNRLFFFNRKTKKLSVATDYFRKKYKEAVTFNALIQDRKGLFWIATDKGLFVYNPATNILIQYNARPFDQISLPNNNIRTVFEDKAGNIWIGTEDGLVKVTPIQQELKFYSFFKDLPKSVRSVYETADKSLWIGTLGDGIYRIRTDGKVENILTDNGEPGFGSNFINYIGEANNGNLLIGTHFGAKIVDPSTGSVTRINIIPYITKDPAIWMKNGSQRQTWAIHQDIKGNLWVAFKDSGLIILKPDGSWQKIGPEQFGLPGSARYSVWTIYEDPGKNIWLGTSLGLQRAFYDGDKFTIEQLPVNSKDNNALHGNNVVCIYQDRKGLLWLAVSDGGLSSFNYQDKKFINYISSSAQNSDIVGSILEDKRGLLWLGTTNGISVFDPHQAKVVRSYNTTDGLLSNHFNFKSCFRNSEGIMFFGCSNGVISFDPEQIKMNDYLPDLLITSFKIQYQDQKNIDLKDSLVTLNYDKSTFSLEFATSDFTNPGKNQFAYQLKGLDKDWVYTGNNHYASFTNLAPGRYTFLLKGTNSDGIWSDKVLSFKIYIKPPYWRTWWFYTLVSLSVLSVIGYYFYLVLRNKDNKRRQVKSELAALRAQLNPHFVFNSLTSLQHFITAHDEELALKYLTRFAQLMRMILENSKRDTITLQEEIDFLKIYFYMESIRVDQKVDFRIEADPALDTEKVLVPPMLLQPLIENSIIHGLVDKQPDGYVAVRFIRNDGYIQCEVEDNGIGREQARQNKSLINIAKTSLGLNIIEERLMMLSIAYTKKAELNVVDLYDRNNIPCGTKIELKIPYL